MKKTVFLKGILTLVSLFILASCGEDDDEDDEYEYQTTVIETQGWHMQGRDCLACHNYDLEENKHLTIGGTVYKTATVTDPDNLDNVCGGEIYVRLVNPYTNEVIDSRDYIDEDSKGYRGKGNIFILTRLYLVLQGEYIVQIIDKNNNILATSNTHYFQTGYDINNPADTLNRYSCNACHSINPKGGAPSVIYVNNPDLCE